MSEKNTPAPLAERCAKCGSPRVGHFLADHNFAPAPLADGGEIRCKECGGNGYLHDVAALRARVAELERVIEEAPHAHWCEREDQKWAGDFACNCFKSKAKVSRG